MNLDTANRLGGMTQAVWESLTPRQRDEMRDMSGLTPHLTGLEGWRVEVKDLDGGMRRFIVGRSTGWRPCHMEIHNRRSRGGDPARKRYLSVRKIEKVRSVA